MKINKWVLLAVLLLIGGGWCCICSKPIYFNETTVFRGGLFASIKSFSINNNKIEIEYHLFFYDRRNWNLERLNVNVIFFNSEKKIIDVKYVDVPNTVRHDSSMQGVPGEVANLEEGSLGLQEVPGGRMRN